MPGYIADYPSDMYKARKVVEKVYIEATITCPHCKAEMNVLPPVKDMAIPGGSEFVCAACGGVSEIYLVAPEPRSPTKRATDGLKAEGLCWCTTCNAWVNYPEHEQVHARR